MRKISAVQPQKGGFLNGMPILPLFKAPEAGHMPSHIEPFAEGAGVLKGFE
jgi:hypothetical protein